MRLWFGYVGLLFYLDLRGRLCVVIILFVLFTDAVDLCFEFWLLFGFDLFGFDLG